MAYFLNIFTPETWRAFQAHGSDITGFSKAHSSRAKSLNLGDRFICYMVSLSRICGVLEVLEGPFEDEAPIFQERNDPWIIRFRVRPIVELSFEQSIPIQADLLWNNLDRTRNIEKSSTGWAVKAQLKSSLVRISEYDGKFIEERLVEQRSSGEIWELDDFDRKRIAKTAADVVQSSTGAVTVVIPESEIHTDETIGAQQLEPSIRDSIRLQSMIVEIGSKMGFKSWVPRADRQRVSEKLLADSQASILDGQLPLNYNDATLKTIENIDVLWMRNRSIVRAFEVEHTTAIYSGLLRMADLLALQPNIDIKLHIVAPDERREKVLTEIRRPVFSLLENGPLSNSCSYLSYTAVESLHAEPRLAYLKDSILEELEEFAEIS